MSEQIDNPEDEAVVAELATQEHYLKHRNQVVCVTDQHLVFLKKKTIGAYFTVEHVPLSECTEIAYRRTYAVGSMIGGAFLALLGALVFLFAVTGERLGLDTVIYGVPLIGVGAALVSGVKRHKLIFRCRHRNLMWISSAGGFKKRLPVLQRLQHFARQQGITVSTFPV